MIATELILAIVVGSALGSFLNVVIHRLPRGESLIAPGSHCPTCSAAVRHRDNVPVVAWIWLRGRCRACHAAISPRYPLVEAATAALCVTVVLTQPTAVRVALGLTAVLVLVPSALIDLDHHLIPNALTGPAAVLALALGSVLDPGGEPVRLIAGAAAGGVFLLCALVSPRGMGMGDVKLAALLGLLLGREVAPALLIALAAGVIVGAVVMARQPAGDRRSAGVPFGPFLALGGLTSIFVGHAILTAYLGALS